MWWWRSHKFRLNVDGDDVHCFVHGLHYFVRVQVWSSRSGKNPGRERRRCRHGRFTQSTRRPSTVATLGAMSKTWSRATKTVPTASKLAKIAGVAVVAAKSANTMATTTVLSTSTSVTNKVREEGWETTSHPLTFSFLPFYFAFFPATVDGVILLFRQS
uniref:Predicted protein n=1 Tax=Hordeum vulgare subsp. vulgare TaxID=112509 RepID=F2CXD2_HORVV|nr:predicted protein [Hordeum vulgare subsp. vulgare]